jgi:hypothetical protein
MAGLLGDSGAAACPRPASGSPPVAGAAAAPMPRTRRQAAPAATFPQRRASTKRPGRPPRAGQSLTVQRSPSRSYVLAALRALHLDTDLPRQALGTYQEDGADSTQTTERRTRKVKEPKACAAHCADAVERAGRE